MFYCIFEVAVALAVFFVIRSVTEAEPDCFEANVEALADDETSVGELCAYNPFSMCLSAGVVYYDNVKAE